jgi:imidazolonepropionase-like amidohydrolase
MDLAREFGFIDRLAFGHASESYPIADLIGKTKAVPVVGPVFIVKFFGDDRSHNIVKELMDAGVPASIQTDKGQEQLRSFREYGSFLIRHGLSESQALEALTINGAKAMMLTDRVGSIEVGKDADLLLITGHPADARSSIEQVLIGGRRVYDAASGRRF